MHYTITTYLRKTNSKQENNTKQIIYIFVIITILLLQVILLLSLNPKKIIKYNTRVYYIKNKGEYYLDRDRS